MLTSNNINALRDRLRANTFFPFHTSIMGLDLSLQEKTILSIVNHITEEGDVFDYTNKQIGKFIILSPSRVSQILSSLSAKGLVSIERDFDGVQEVRRTVHMLCAF